MRGPGVSGVLMRVPGVPYLAASPHWSRETQPKGWDEAPAAAGSGDAAAAKAAANGNGDGGVAPIVKDVATGGAV